jgi:hypothetical protein
MAGKSSKQQGVPLAKGPDGCSETHDALMIRILTRKESGILFIIAHEK